MLPSPLTGNISFHLVKVQMFVSGITLARIGILPKQRRLCLLSFLSHNATIAIPWCGIESAPLSPSLGEELIQRSSLFSPDCFFMSRGFLSELVPKVSATWPEETLLDSGQTVFSPTLCKSEYRFLRSACKGMSNSHLRGQVIVTAGSDGFIRVYQNYGLPVRV
jgi:hypothetical protein